MNEYTTQLETTNKILAYLGTRPYQEVEELVSLIRQEYADALAKDKESKAVSKSTSKHKE